jgi:Flp pilus assembly pilin Flp
MLDRINTLVVHLFSRVELAREEGQGTVEYALILAAIVLAVATLLSGIGTTIAGKLTLVSNAL